MNKTDLIKAISEQSGFTNKDAHTFLDAFIDVTTATLSKGEEDCINRVWGIFCDQKSRKDRQEFSNR